MVKFNRELCCCVQQVAEAEREKFVADQYQLQMPEYADGTGARQITAKGLLNSRLVRGRARLPAGLPGSCFGGMGSDTVRVAVVRPRCGRIFIAGNARL